MNSRPASILHTLPENHSILHALISLAQPLNNIILYSAGFPNFPANFTRDSILSSILFEDPIMLRDQLTYAALMQGRERNPFNGEEPGKIFHEQPPATIRKLSTEYNSCDATALFLIGHEMYLTWTDDDGFIQRQQKYLEKAVEYILSHLVNNLFVEDPRLCGAKEFALRVTYWKDSQIHNRTEGLPIYPAVFTLAHVQNMRALNSAAALLNAPDLATKAKLMLKHLSILYNEKMGIFNTGLDQRGFFSGVSSDSLHLLYYLEPDEIAAEKVHAIVKTSEVLETKFGYRTLSPHDQYNDVSGTVEDGYHARTVWPFEQAFIHQAAKKFHLEHVMDIAARVRHQLKDYPELFVIDDDGIKKGGSTTQLWTIAAARYFSKQ